MRVCALNLLVASFIWASFVSTIHISAPDKTNPDDQAITLQPTSEGVATPIAKLDTAQPTQAQEIVTAFTGVKDTLASPDSVSPKILKVFWINLDKDPQRRSNFEKQIPSFPDIEFVRVPGVFMKEWNEQADLQTLVKGGECTNGMTSGACGSDLAHRRAYNLVAAEKKPGYYLVAEDDVTFASNFASEFAAAVPTLPDNNWPMLRIGWWDHRQWNGKDNNFIEKSRISGTKWLRGEKCAEGNCFQGACGVVLTPDKARALIDKLKGEPARNADAFTGGYCLDHPVVVPRDDSWGASSHADPFEPHAKDSSPQGPL